MCDPISIAATAVASSVVSLVGQSQAASAQRDAINQALGQANQQIAQQKQAEENDRLRAARQEDSRIRVAAGEAGLSLGSQSIEMMLLNNQMQTGLADERIGLNADLKRQSALAEAQQQMASTSTPNFLGAGLRVGLAGLDGFIQGKHLQALRDPASKAAAAKASPVA